VLAVSDHAVQRFIQRWHPGMPFAEARAVLKDLVSRAAPTRRKTLPGDAWIYTVHTEDGERIVLAVRNNVVVTVLDADTDEAVAFRHSLEDKAMLIEALDEHHARRAAQLATERAMAQRRSAERTIAEWKAGASFSAKVIERARRVLSLRDDELSRLRIEGGPYDGLCIEIPKGESMEETIERLREAMRARQAGVVKT
jgi:hypothetical protein